MLNVIGSTTNFVNAIPVPQDGVDNDTAASLQPGFQQLADNVATEKTDRTDADTAESDARAIGDTDRVDDLLTSGTWTFPAGVFAVEVEGCGGGASGGGGSTGSTVNANASTGGGGGGGAEDSVRIVTGNPGDVINHVIGAGGASVAAGTPGNDGGDSSFGATAVFRGAGAGSSSASSGNPNPCSAYGGPPVAISAALKTYYGDRAIYTSAPQKGDIIKPVPGHGGQGINQVAPFAGLNSPDGMPSAQGFAGGVGGTFGATNVGVGGSGGGGGGAGPYGAGGHGGNGGVGNTGAAAPAGGALLGATAGADAAANTGAGGGGGGGGGSSAAGAGTGYISGAGGSGRLRVRYRGPQAVIT